MLFRKKKYASKENASKWQDSIALKILQGYRRVQLSWVKLMERSIGKLSLTYQKFFFFILILSGSLYFGSVVYRGINRQSHNKIDVGAINPGKHIGSPGDMGPGKKHDFSIDPGAQQLQHLKQYLDSLKTTDKGKRTYDSIMFFHPDILDSIILLENMHQRQK